MSLSHVTSNKPSTSRWSHALLEAAAPVIQALEPRQLLAASAWSYQGNVDESMFASGGTGTVIYASPTGASGNTGAQSSPYDLATAITKAGQAMQSQETLYTKTTSSLSVSNYWLKIARSGNSFTTYTSTDSSGAPTSWTAAGSAKTISMGSEVYVGVMVTSGDWRPSGTDAAKAVFDNIKVGGNTVADANWSSTVIYPRGTNSASISSGTATLQGNGENNTNSTDWYDSGSFLYVKVSGDTEVVARVTSMTRSPSNGKKASAAVVIRDGLTPGARKMELELNQYDSSGTEKRDVWQGWRADKATAGKDTKVVLLPGTYRRTSTMSLPDRDEVARNKTFVIEGQNSNGTGNVIISGSNADNWAASGWTAFDLNGDGTIDANDKGVYYRSGWNNNWFFNGAASDATTGNRREMLFLTKSGGSAVRLTQKMLENWSYSSYKYTYNGYTALTTSNIDTALPAGSFAVNELGTDSSDASMSVSTPSGSTTFKAIYDANAHGYGNTVFMRLPSGISDSEFFSNDGNTGNDTSVELPAFNDSLIRNGGSYNMKSPGGNNLVFRNLVFQHSAANNAVQLGDWTQPMTPPQNWKIEDVTFRNNAQGAFSIDHLRNFTVQRLNVTDNGYGSHFVANEGKILDSNFTNNAWRKRTDGILWNAFRNVQIDNLTMTGNVGNVFRNDHVAENLLIENSKFNNNTGRAMIFETALGPITIKNSEVKNNTVGTGTEDNGTIGIWQAQNITFDSTVFDGNTISVFDFYDRDRAHTANTPGGDELANNLDVGQWDKDGSADGRTTPGGKKNNSWNRNIVVKNSTFKATGSTTMFYRSHVWTSGQRQWAYNRAIADELIAYNNTYYNADNTKPFEGKDQVKKTFAEWKAVSTQPNFEASSEWTSGTRTSTFTPTAMPIDPSDSNKSGTLVATGRYHYEVENVNYNVSSKAGGGNQDVELITDSAASAGKAHKLRVDVISDTVGDYITYNINVPVAGDYYVLVRYLQDEGAFKSLGYAQLKIDGNVQGSYWDQSGLTREFKDAHLEKVTLTAGDHAFRFDPIWRNGYISGKYDITIDRIELVSVQDLRASGSPTVSTNGLSYKYYETTSDWYQLPSFSSLTATSSGTQTAANRKSFSDDFADSSISTNWMRTSGTNLGTWAETSGILTQSATAQLKDGSGNVNGRYKALLTTAATPLTSGDQEIVAKVRVNSWTDGKFAKAGVSLFNDNNSASGNYGKGYQLVFSDNHSTLKMMNQWDGNGPSTTFNWSDNTWYWFKFRSEGGSLLGKIWADGSTEPSGWMLTWNQVTATGTPGLSSGSGDASVSFDDASVKVLSNFSLAVKPSTRTQDYGLVYEGFLEVPTDGLYTFYTKVNDGGNLYIGDTLVIDNDGVHDGERNEPWEKFGKIALKAGKHPIKATYFNNINAYSDMTVSWEGPNISKQLIPDNKLWIKGTNNAPIAATNSGLAVNTNAANVVVNNDKLKLTDTDADTLTYTLTAIPASGSLKLNGNTLAVGGKFTQEDIDRQRLTYTSGSSAGSVNLKFTASDGQGGSVAETTFNITVGTATTTPAEHVAINFNTTSGTATTNNQAPSGTS
ncbi:MAG TPA: PA14 domain-containing protein, partial [Tepidisphaeraceae bacterium]|nr:PA14 domain-containing protein [Tepidisphaeraceae bacterium]